MAAPSPAPTPSRTLWTEPSDLRLACDDARRRGLRVGVVPTMGALHEGHATLVRTAARECDFVVVTVFVNPTQFGPSEDLDSYPRTLEADRDKCLAAGAHGVFAPATGAMYPPGEDTRVRLQQMEAALCGQGRPGHFEGVATIVTKLLSIVGPCAAMFGRKDYQQLALIRRMCRDLFLPVAVVGVTTVREADGLAMSSRNAYLTPKERLAAVAIARGLSWAVTAFERGERRAATLVDVVQRALNAEGASLAPEYITLTDPDSIVPLTGEQCPDRALLAVACRVGKARLIDNVVLGEDSAPIVPSDE